MKQYVHFMTKQNVSKENWFNNKQFKREQMYHRFHVRAIYER